MLKIRKSLICFIFVFLLKRLFREDETLILGIGFSICYFATAFCPFFWLRACLFKNSQNAKDIRTFSMEARPPTRSKMLNMRRVLLCLIVILLQKLLFRRGETLIFGICFFVPSFASVSCPFYLVRACNFKNSQIVKDIRNFLLKSWPCFSPAIIDFLNFALVFNDF